MGSAQEEETKPRKNGFERPFHPFQLVSWAVFGTDCLIFCIFGIPLIETVFAKIVVGVPFVASCAVLVRFAVQATRCDPADPHIFLQASDPQMSEESTSTLPICGTCNTPVFARSKHCRTCRKCVHVFDHHCIWLNNCIGEYNYRAFAMCISSVAVMTGTCLVSCIYLLIDFFINDEAFADRFDDNPIFGSAPKGLALGLLCVMIFVNLPLYVLDMQLVVLHCFLASQQLTTYDYIMNKKNLQMENADKPGRASRVLPSCMDWIVYRSGKRRPKKGDAIEQMEAPPPLRGCTTDSAEDDEREEERPSSVASTAGEGVDSMSGTAKVAAYPTSGGEDDGADHCKPVPSKV